METRASAGRTLGGRFVVEREVGRGGAGVVYRAHDLETRSPVALKVVELDAAVPEEAPRLAREGQLLAGLDHPGIVKTVGWGVLDDTSQPYVAMEWLEGEDLAQRHARAPLGMREILELGIYVSEALEAAHLGGVVHRDIKPGNIFLCRPAPADAEDLDATPKLVDFGVAARGDLGTTRAGDLVGTPAYMAPEQARGDATVDARSDIYSLGATLFELVSGRPPHVGPTPIATLARLVTTPAPRLSELRRDTPPILDELTSQMLETAPERRPASAGDVARALREAMREGVRSSWVSLPLGPGDPALSSRLGAGGSRLVTSIVALRFGTGSARERALEHLTARGADAVRLGQDALVAHLGARRAVGSEAPAAIDLGRRLARAGAKVGIASGRARVDRADATGEVRALGDVVDRASALARDAGQGQVLVDATTAELGRGRWEFRARDDGSSIVGEQSRVARERSGGAPFVGREPELAQVLSAVERARAAGAPVLVSISGPPGIGKSRLRREVLARIAARANAPIFVLQRSDAYGRGHALGAAADVLRALTGLPKGATSREAARALDARRSGPLGAEGGGLHRELLARLLANEPLPEGLDPRGSRDALWLAMTDAVLDVLRQRPVIIVVEDLQWADAESVGWLDHLLGRATGSPLVVLALMRPGFFAEQPGRFAGRDHVRIDLRPISPRASRAIARAVLGEGSGDDVVERIVEQAGGLPLFAEELARLSASGRDPTHAPTIEAAIQVSLDALDEDCRDAVARLSVYGQAVWDSGLEALGVREAEAAMKALGGAEILIEHDVSRFSGTREWTFKHALVRDVAYAALAEEPRKELHARAGRWLASMGEDAAIVAGHLDRGAQHAEAAAHWARAAQRALATNALADAVQMAERALAFAEDAPSGFLRAGYLDEAWSRLDPRASDRDSAVRALEENVYDDASAARARGARARYDDALGTGDRISERLTEIRDEAAALGLYDEDARCSAALATRLAFAGAFAEAEAESQRLLTLSAARGIAAAAVDAWQTLAIIRQTRGALSSALDARRNAVAAASAAALEERAAMLTTNLGFALTTIGARQEARAALEAGLARADAIGSVGAVRHAQMNLLGWAATFGNDRALDVHLAETRADADAAGSGSWTAPDRANLGVVFYRGWELLRGGGDSGGRRAATMLRLAAQGYRATGNRDVLPVALGVWADAERRCGELDAAAELAREAAGLLDGGAPSLLNESTVFVALHDACLDLGLLEEARRAIARGMPLLVRRVQGLVGTPYARSFLTELPPNTSLLAAAEGYGLVPDVLHRLLERDGG
ncbi:MAG: AAA family ATPase [Polyangiaceae bacterium]|nr:AAA family ATPase [Polyangiaceae bacterium]